MRRGEILLLSLSLSSLLCGLGEGGSCDDNGEGVGRAGDDVADFLSFLNNFITYIIYLYRCI